MYTIGVIGSAGYISPDSAFQALGALFALLPICVITAYVIAKIIIRRFKRRKRRSSLKADRN